MTRPLRQRLRRPPAVQHARLAAAAPAASRAAEVADAPWYRLGPTMEVVGVADGDEQNPAASRADVYVYDYIGGWRGSTSENFVRDVAGLDVDELHVHLNSPGGDAFEGITIANVLRAHRARVTVWVDGLAASAASVIAMAGDEVVMGIGAQLMIHDASTYAWGDAVELRKAADSVDSLSQGVAKAYSEKAGGTVEQWRAVMVAETWYDGPSAVTAGLADREATADDAGHATGQQIVPGSTEVSIWDWWDAASVPAQHAATVRALYAHPPVLVAGPRSPAASAGGSTSTQEGALMPTLIEALRQRLGLPDDATEDDVTDALDEQLPSGNTDPDPASAEPATEPASEPSEESNEESDEESDGSPQQNADGTVTLDAGAYEVLRRGAQAGTTALARQAAEDRDRLLTAAVSDGRIPPASRKHWDQQLKGPGADAARKTLASFPKGLIPVDGEVGHDLEGAAEKSTSLEATRASAAYQSWSI